VKDVGAACWLGCHREGYLSDACSFDIFASLVLERRTVFEYIQEKEQESELR
jgi:hypothetical protein